MNNPPFGSRSGAPFGHSSSPVSIKDPAGEQSAELLEVLLVRQILLDSRANTRSRDWIAHSLGMLRLNVASNFRLHVWDSRVADPRVAQVHSHPYASFESRVVCGEIENEIFDVTACAIGVIPTHIEHVVTPGHTLTRDVVLGRVDFRTVTAGDSYKLDTRPHRTRALDGTITAMMTFDNLGSTATYVPGGVAVTGAVVRSAMDYEIAAMCDTALVQICARARELGAKL